MAKFFFRNDSVIDTCERYWDESKQKKSRKEKSVEKFSFEGERKSSKQQKTTKSTSIDTEKGKTCVEKEGQPRLKREKEEKPSEDCKRRKINVDVTDSSVVLEIDKISELFGINIGVFSNSRTNFFFDFYFIVLQHQLNRI